MQLYVQNMVKVNSLEISIAVECNSYFQAFGPCGVGTYLQFPLQLSGTRRQALLFSQTV